MVERHYLHPSCGLHGHNYNQSLADNNDNDRCYDNHDHLRLDCEFDSYFDRHFGLDDVNNGVAGSGRLLAEFGAGEGLRQYVVAEWTGHCSCWCDCGAGGQQ